MVYTVMLFVFQFKEKEVNQATTFRPVIRPKEVPLVNNSRYPKKPKEHRIVLSISGEYKGGDLFFDLFRLIGIAKILAISEENVTTHAFTAIQEGKPQVVACYQQSDIAETKLSQLQKLTPFIREVSHHFEMVVT